MSSAGLFCPALTINCSAGPASRLPHNHHGATTATDDDGGAPTDDDGGAPAARYDDHLSLLDEIVDLPWADLVHRERHSFGIIG